MFSKGIDETELNGYDRTACYGRVSEIRSICNAIYCHTFAFGDICNSSDDEGELIGSNEKAGWKLCATFLSSWLGALSQLRCVLCRAAKRNRSEFVQRDRNLDRNGGFDSS